MNVMGAKLSFMRMNALLGAMKDKKMAEKLMNSAGASASKCPFANQA
jgi:hypothetical protein